jgi:hypothetical protein
MDGSAPTALWTPISLLKSRFEVNLQSLKTRYPQLVQQLTEIKPRQTYQLMPSGDSLQLGAGNGLGTTPLPHSLSATAARDVMQKLYPSGFCTQPVLISGEDMGWLWNGVYRLPCQTPATPGHRPPLFFLMGDLERLWVILHIHDWRELLADPRVRLMAGPGAFQKFRQSLVSDAGTPWPKLCVRIDPTIWNGEPSLDQLLAEAGVQTNDVFRGITDRFRLCYAGATPESISGMLASGKPLKVLGITSRFTTFLQHSMRDWLAAFGRLGHQTRLVIEQHDHEVCNGLGIAGACADFQPDMVVIIDHYRSELSGLPEQIPVVMWVQDALPNIYRNEAGKGQKRLDYTIGYGRTQLTTRHAYPAGRFMPAMVGVNSDRFSEKPIPDAELAPHRCDISFVSHATAPAERFIAEESERSGSAEVKRLLHAIYDRLRAIYESGDSVSAGDVLRQIIMNTMRDLRISGNVGAFEDLFSRRVNNALFRHQSVRWVAEMGVNLHLYGHGWENHPEFKRFARGVADNQAQLPAIYQASAINLQVTPFGAVHQRLMDGLAAGGFFLCRTTALDALESLRREIWNWCQKRKVRSGPEMLGKCDAALNALLREYTVIEGSDPAGDINYFFAGLEECQMTGFTRTVNTLFQNHAMITFGNRAQLTEKVKKYLADPSQRKEIAAGMRRRVLETHTYESITRRMLRFMADDLARDRAGAAAVAA